MLVLESYKTFGVDFQEVAMTGESERFDRVGQASERTDRREVRIPGQRRNGPADQLMYAWSLDATDPQEEPTKITQRLESCPPEVYIG